MSQILGVPLLDEAQLQAMEQRAKDVQDGMTRPVQKVAADQLTLIQHLRATRIRLGQLDLELRAKTNPDAGHSVNDIFNQIFGANQHGK
jgi:hypothetical protein